MLDRIASFVRQTGVARRSARGTFAAGFAQPTIEERILRALRRMRRA